MVHIRGCWTPAAVRSPTPQGFADRPRRSAIADDGIATRDVTPWTRSQRSQQLTPPIELRQSLERVQVHRRSGVSSLVRPWTVRRLPLDVEVDDDGPAARAPSRGER